MTTTESTLGRKFWGGWGLAFLGFPLGGLAGQAVTGGVETVLDGVVGGTATGAVIGLAQWLVLRTRMQLSPWWIAASSAGMAAGLAAGVGMFGTTTDGVTLLYRGAVTGMLIGLAQWPLLQPITKHAGWWVPLVAVGWAVGWAVTRAAGVGLTPNFTVFGATGAWAFQLISGLALSWLLRQPYSTSYTTAHVRSN